MQRQKRPADAVFRALADETRREILQMLRAGPRTSGELAAAFDSSWPTISRHLAVLREGGLVVAERQGQEIHYELNTSVFEDLVQHLMQWIEPAVTTRRTRVRSLRRAPRQQEV
jgi:DNA-binding transcriptional ArsR family regulator